MMPIRIARVCPYFYGKRENLDSGLKPYYFNIIKEMSKYKLPNDIYTEETDSKDSPNVFTIKKRRRFSYLLFGYDIYKKIKESKKTYDIIHTHQAGCFMLYFFKNKFRPKFVHTLHGSPLAIKKVPIKSWGSFKDMLYFYIFNRYICKRADAIITVSSEAKNEIIEKFHINKDKVFMIPTAVDTSIFKKTNSKKER